MTRHDTQTEVIRVIVIIFSLVGLSASVVLLYLIQKMKVRNGHVLLIRIMTLFQLLYDTGYILKYTLPLDSDYIAATNIMQIIGGLSGSIISNVVAFTACYVVMYRETFDVYHHIYSILTVALVPAAVASVLYAIGSAPPSSTDYLINIANFDIYYPGRIVCIGINFLLVILTFSYIHRFLDPFTGYVRSDVGRAIRTLARRMIYYPVIQAVSRSGCAYYDIKYGFVYDTSTDNADKLAALLYAAIVTPIASVGFLVIFVVMQPTAKQHLIALLRCQQYTADDESYLRSLSTDDQSNPRTSSSISVRDSFQMRLHQDSNLGSNLADYGGGGGGSNISSSNTGSTSLRSSLQIQRMSLGGGVKGAGGRLPSVASNVDDDTYEDYGRASRETGEDDDGEDYLELERHRSRTMGSSSSGGGGGGGGSLRNTGTGSMGGPPSLTATGGAGLGGGGMDIDSNLLLDSQLSEIIDSSATAAAIGTAGTGRRTRSVDNEGQGTVHIQMRKSLTSRLSSATGSNDDISNNRDSNSNGYDGNSGNDRGFRTRSVDSVPSTTFTSFTSFSSSSSPGQLLKQNLLPPSSTATTPTIATSNSNNNTGEQKSSSTSATDSTSVNNIMHS